MYLNREITLNKRNLKVVGEKSEGATEVDGEKIEEILSRESTDFSNTRTIKSEVAYWRKFNALHAYMCERFNDSDNDNCVDMSLRIDDLKELGEKLTELITKAKLGKGRVSCGTTYTSGKPEEEVELANGEKKLVKDLEVGDKLFVSTSEQAHNHNDYEKVVSSIEKHKDIIHYVIEGSVEGRVVLNPEVCKDILPTTEGFYFGSTDYDDYYIEEVADTISVIDRIVAEHNELVASGVKEYNIRYIYSAWY